MRDWRVLYLSACWLLIAAAMFGLTFFIPIIVGALFSGGAVSGTAGAGHHSACGAGSSSSGGDGTGPASSPPPPQVSSAMVALAAAVPFLAAAAGMNVNARLAERANERHRHAGIPILLAAATLAALPLALRLAGPGLAFALLSLACGFCWSFHGGLLGCSADWWGWQCGAQRYGGFGMAVSCLLLAFQGVWSFLLSAHAASRPAPVCAKQQCPSAPAPALQAPSSPGRPCSSLESRPPWGSASSTAWERLAASSDPL